MPLRSKPMPCACSVLDVVDPMFAYAPQHATPPPVRTATAASRSQRFAAAQLAATAQLSVPLLLDARRGTSATITRLLELMRLHDGAYADDGECRHPSTLQSWRPSCAVYTQFTQARKCFGISWLPQSNAVVIVEQQDAAGVKLEARMISASCVHSPEACKMKHKHNRAYDT